MNNYPPGVTGNEPEITGAWNAPCADCGTEFSDKDDDKVLFLTDAVVCFPCAIERIKNTFKGIDLLDLEFMLFEHIHGGE